MRRALAISALLLCAATAPVTAFDSPPVIAFDTETCDLGSVVQGELADCVFAFSNSGSADLRILRVEPSCGCTTALLSSPVVRAGERGGVRVVFDSDNFTGEVVKEVEVRANDLTRPVVTLRVRALVEPEIDFEPRVVAFDDVRAGAALKQVVMLTNRRAEPVKVTRLASEPSSYGCRIPSWSDRAHPLVIESWDRVALEVHFTPPGALAMPIAGECTLEIAGSRKKSFRLKLLALPAP